MALEFEVLQIVIMPRQIQMHFVFAEKRLPICNEYLMVAVRAV